MRFRKLRIAWSVMWGLIAVLLCMLWLRSYEWNDIVFMTSTTSVTTTFGSNCGSIYYFHGMTTGPSRDWTINSGEAAEPGPKFELRHTAREFWVEVPFWIGLAPLAILVGAPWLRSRFSLRTLLIATTLVAVVLGAIVYATR